MEQTARGTWNFVGKPATLAQGCASEAHLKHGCEYAPVAGRIRNFIEILSAPCRLAVASASRQSRRKDSLLQAKCVSKNDRTFPVHQKKTSPNGSNNTIYLILSFLITRVKLFFYHSFFSMPWQYLSENILSIPVIIPHGAVRPFYFLFKLPGRYQLAVLAADNHLL